MEMKDQLANKPGDVVEATDLLLLHRASLMTMRTFKTLKRRTGK